MEVVQQDTSPAVVITVNVGGVLYTTTDATLTNVKESKLAKWFDGSQSVLPRDLHGNPFIDRDGPMFGHVLNFLRSGKLALADDFREHKKLEYEAEFYQIQPLTDAIRQMGDRTSRNIIEMYHTIEGTRGNLHERQMRNCQLKIYGDQSVTESLSNSLTPVLRNRKANQPDQPLNFARSSPNLCLFYNVTPEDKITTFDHMLKTGWQLVSSSLSTMIASSNYMFSNTEIHYIWSCAK